VDREQIRSDLLAAWTEYRGIADAARAASRGLDDAERERRTVLEGKISELESQLQDAEREAELSARMAAIEAAGEQRNASTPAGSEPAQAAYSDVFQRYLRDGVSGLTPAEVRTLQSGVDESIGRQLRDQGVTTGALGGYTVPEGFWAKVTETMKQFGGMLQLANTLNTASGNTIPWATNDDTGNEGEILGENVATTVLDLSFGTNSLGAHMFTSRLIKVSLQLLQDTGIDLESFIGRKAGERIGRRLNRALTVGSGTGEPQGIVTGATNVLTLAAGNTGVVNAFWKSLVDLELKVDAAYREGGNVAYMLNDTTLGAIMKTEDADGRPLWQPSIRDGVPGTINGRRYVVNNQMASPAANAKTIVFGDIRQGYVVRNVSGGGMLRLSERYAEQLQVAFLMFSRHDGLVDDQAAIAVLQHSAT